MRNLFLTVSRFAISAWVGAASLFVITTLREVQATQLDSTTKAHLAVLRFPAYYEFAFALIGSAWLFAVCAKRSLPRRRWVIAVICISVPLALTVLDYFWVYKPLEQMTALVEQSRPAHFVSYHRASKYINCVQVAVSAIAAVVICWPTHSTES